MAHGTDVTEVSEVAARVAQERVAQPDLAEDVLEEVQTLGIESVAAEKLTLRLTCVCSPAGSSPCSAAQRGPVRRAGLHAHGSPPRAADDVTWPNPQSFYAEVGGAPVFAKIISRFYEEVARDEVLRPLYPEEDLGPAEERLRMFLEQYWGGPRTYSDQRGHPRLRMRHMPFRIGRSSATPGCGACGSLWTNPSSTTSTVRNCGSTCSMRPSA